MSSFITEFNSVAMNSYKIPRRCRESISKEPSWALTGNRDDNVLDSRIRVELTKPWEGEGRMGLFHEKEGERSDIEKEKQEAVKWERQNDGIN